MSRWLLNTFPTWLLSVLILGGLVLFAVCGLVLVRRRFAAVRSGEHNEAVTFLTGIVVGVYGIVLAFVIVTHYEDFADAEATVNREAVALVQLHRESGAFPTSVRERLRSGISRYESSVTGPEWRAMEDGKGSAATRGEVGRLYRVLQQYAPRGPTQSAFYGSAVARLDDLVAARRDRLQHAAQALPGPFEILIFGGAFAVTCLLWFFAIPSLRMQIALVAVVAGLIGFNLLISALLDHPFSGDFSVSTAPYEAVRELRPS